MARAARRLALNTAAPMAARLIDAAFAVVYLRLLGRSEVGAYAFLVVFTTYLDTLIDFGLNALVAREVSRGSVAPTTAFRAVNLLRLGLWLVGLPIVAVMYFVFPQAANLSAQDALGGGIFYLALLPTILAKTATGLLWAAERLDLTAAVSVMATVLKTALGAILLFTGFGVIGLAVASLVVNVVTAITLWRLTPHNVAHGDGVHLRVGDNGAPIATDSSLRPISWLRESWPLFVNQLLQ